MVVRIPWSSLPSFGSLLLLLALVPFSAPAAFAARGDCGQPVSTGADPIANDCLFILRSAVGISTCDPDCICDLNGTGGITTADALRCLRRAIDPLVDLDCDCPVVTTTLGPSLAIDPEITGEATPGAVVVADANVTLTGDCALQSVVWEQTSGEPVTIATANAETSDITLADRTAFREQLILVLEEPPIKPEDLPPNVELREGEFFGGLQDRFTVVGINPFALEEAGALGFRVTVTSSCGTQSKDVAVAAELPWSTTGGIHNVPIDVPVVLHGRSHVDENEDNVDDVTGAATTYDWALTAPQGSAAVLAGAASQDPEFTPDVAGPYRVTVTDTTRLPGTNVVTLDIYAGTWRGAITGQDAKSLPLAANCTGCHNGTIAPDNFTPWRATGHAEILENNLNTNSHYGEACFTCHMVGWNKNADNGGADEADDYQAFLDSGLLGSVDADNWTDMLADFPDSAQMSNVQCENCHGPQDASGPHTQGAPRMSLSSDMCAVCHGEPLRHSRFQQWQLSRHGDYEGVIGENKGTNGNCARCHSVNGFLVWLPVLTGETPGDPLANIAISWTIDETHPQTCSACHDPHSIGTTSGNDPNATVRISGNTPPLIAGFQAFGVGKGAICMTCHNSRRGLRNDDNFDTIRGTSDTSRAPHNSAQADVFMGENAYLVNVGIRGSHSLVENTCVNCHMERTPPPNDLSYNQSGTNHTFFASKDICSDCHGAAFNADGVGEAFQASIDQLGLMVEDAMLQLMADQIALGRVIALVQSGQPDVIITDVSTIADLTFGEESSGRQAITFTFVDESEVGPIGLNNVRVRDGVVTANCPDALTRCELYDFADDRLVKGAWNWYLCEFDGSEGIHNPAFVLEVLDASIDALTALAAGQ